MYLGIHYENNVVFERETIEENQHISPYENWFKVLSKRTWKANQNAQTKLGIIFPPGCQ